MSPAMGPTQFPGAPLWDLYQHLIEQPYTIDGEEYHFFDTDGFMASGLEVYALSAGHVGGTPFRIELRHGSNLLELWYGWRDATFHCSRTWQLGKWRQDKTPPLGGRLYPEYLGTTQQVATVEEAHQPVERALARLMTRLTRCSQHETYQLEWAEVTAMLCQFRDRWNDKEDDLGSAAYLVRPSRASVDARTRQGAITLGVHEDGADRVTLKAARDRDGWRLDVYTPLADQRADGCMWWGAIAFHGDYTGEVREVGRVRCPSGHDHWDELHRIWPWGLGSEIEEQLELLHNWL